MDIKSIWPPSAHSLVEGSIPELNKIIDQCFYEINEYDLSWKRRERAIDAGVTDAEILPKIHVCTYACALLNHISSTLRLLLHTPNSELKASHIVNIAKIIHKIGNYDAGMCCYLLEASIKGGYSDAIVKVLDPMSVASQLAKRHENEVKTKYNKEKKESVPILNDTSGDLSNDDLRTIGEEIKNIAKHGIEEVGNPYEGMSIKIYNKDPQCVWVTKLDGSHEVFRVEHSPPRFRENIGDDPDAEDFVEYIVGLLNRKDNPED